MREGRDGGDGQASKQASERKYIMLLRNRDYDRRSLTGGDDKHPGGSPVRAKKQEHGMNKHCTCRTE